jgi:selenocysteine lyase/cysteine desulfurase
VATWLYLDTARLGQMSRSAQLAHIDFARWAGEEAGSLYFEDFLRHGSAALPPSLRNRYRGMASWQGIVHLKQDLKTLAGARAESRLLVTNRSSQLMRFAARLLFDKCRNVLVTDLSWPAYADILARQARTSGNRLTRIVVRDAILRGQLNSVESIDSIATTFERHRCDGLFLPTVDNLGIRLPIEDLVRAIRRRANLPFVVVDGAQAFCHVPLNLAADFCDFFIAGCHKWLRAYQPMGLGFYGRRGSREDVDATLQRMLASGDLDDPLLALSEDLECGRVSQFGETVNLAPLFTCRGAVDDALAAEQGVESNFEVRLANAEEFVEVARTAGWNVLQPQPEFRSGIVLLRSPDAGVRALPPEALRRRLLQHGIAATTYSHGTVRLSMPSIPFEADDLAVIKAALTPEGLAVGFPPLPVNANRHAVPQR